MGNRECDNEPGIQMGKRCFSENPTVHREGSGGQERERGLETAPPGALVGAHLLALGPRLAVCTALPFASLRRARQPVRGHTARATHEAPRLPPSLPRSLSLRLSKGAPREGLPGLRVLGRSGSGAGEQAEPPPLGALQLTLGSGLSCSTGAIGGLAA